MADCKPQQAAAIPAMKHYFKAYATSDLIRHVIDGKQYGSLYTNSAFTAADLKAVPEPYRTIIPEYIKDYVPLNLFAA